MRLIMRWLGKGRLRFHRGQRGLTLIEVVVAAAILAVIGVVLLNALDTNAKATRQLDEKVVATNLATAYFEAIKAMPYAPSLELPSYPEPKDIITVPPQYIVNVDLYFSSDGDTTDGQITWVDEEDYTGETLQKIIVSVLREGKPVLSICTYRTEG